MSEIYLVRTYMQAKDDNGDVKSVSTLNGVCLSREDAEACIEEIKGRNMVRRHGIETSNMRVDVTKIEANKYYEEI